MASERQIAANRRNALKSTGPRTKVGKERASHNAYRHGLKSRGLAGRSAQEIEDLAHQIAGEANSPFVLEWARAAAEATLEMARVRRTRLVLIEQVSQRGDLPDRPRFSSVAEIRLLSRWLKDREGPEVTPSGAADPSAQEHDRTAEAVRCLLPQLQLLARYEGRAWSRREKALRAIQELRCRQTNPIYVTMPVH